MAFVLQAWTPINKPLALFHATDEMLRRSQTTSASADIRPLGYP
jgi:hypothetical protein